MLTAQAQQVDIDVSSRADDMETTGSLPYRIWGIVMRFMGSTTRMRMMRSRLPSDSNMGSLNRPLLIFLNKLGMDSSSKGRLPHNKAYLYARPKA